MANRVEKLRKAYEFKLGKDIASKLSDEQIALISKHYNSLSEDEQSQIDSYIVMGKTNDLSEMANGFIEEEKQSSSKQSPIAIKEDSPKIIGTEKKITAESFKNKTSLDVIERIQETIESISKVPQGIQETIETISKVPQETIESISKVPQETIETISKVPQEKEQQSSTGGSIVPVKRDGEDLVDEQIDERILRLLELDYIFDIDYDTYKSLLKEKMVAARMAKTQIPTEEVELLTNEYKKIKGKKGRFKVKKITADSLKKGSAVGINLGKQKALIGDSLKALPPADKMTGGSDIKEIIDALAEIIKSLTSQNKLAKDSAEKSRIAGEAGQRGAKESRLEKGFKFAIKAAEKIIAPIKSLLDRIIDFFVAIFVGRALIKLLDWFSDSKNQDKIKAIGRFLGDQWPKLLALYIMFGTGLGKFVGFLTKIVIRGGIKLAAAAAGLLAKAGVGKAAGAAKFLGGKGGKIAGAVLGVAATVGTTMAVSKGIENFGGIGGEEQKTQGYSGGGFVIPKFAGGGLNFKGMMGGAGMGSMFGPLGMLLGAGLGSGKIQETVSGLIGGKKGVDKVPAMLTDGEFVMSRGAVQKYGVDTLEGMNAAGGGTNQPKIVSGTTYAAGGGMIGDQKENVRDRILEKREKQQKAGSSSKQITPKSTTPKSTLPNLSPIEMKFASRAKQRGITDPIELKAFLSQVKHESGGNFGEPQREKYNSSPNDPPGKPGYEYFKGYANPALGLGNRNADDAYNYIGRGYLQVTGRANYDDIGKRIGKDLVGNPKLLMNKDIALDASIEYWKRSVRPNVKNWNNTFEVSRAVNKPSAVSPDEITGMTDREDAFQGYSAIPNKTFTNLKTDVAAKPKPSIKNQPNMFQKFGSAISSIISPPALAEQPSSSSKLNPAQIQTQNNVPRINPPSKSKVKVVYATSPGGMPKLNTSSGASPSVPSFSAVHPNSESRRRNAAVLGVK